MDIQAMQSMDWLFKKERFYLLVQFWQQRATLAEKEVSSLKEQLATANQNLQLADERKTGNGNGSDMDGQMDVISRSSIELELAAKEKEICQLVEDVQRLQSSVSKLQENSATQIARLEEQLDHKRQHITRIEQRLDAQRDYDDLKRELAILRSLDFASMGAAVNSADAPAKALDLLLIERSKALQQQHAESNGPKSVSSCSDLPGVTTTTTTTTTTPSLHHLTDTPTPIDHPPPPPPPPLPPPLFPAPLQNVETFGSFLGEEIVANWRRSLERSILSQNHALQANHLQAMPSPTEEASTPHDDAVKEVTSPCTTSSPTSFINTTPTISSPLAGNGDIYNHHLMNGNPKTPEDSNVLCNNNNNHLNNNNMSTPPTPVPGPLSFFRDVDIKSPFRFDDPRSPFRFADEGVMVGRLGDSLIPKGDPMEARLQEMLRYNMDKYASQNLDTLHISRRVRELLSINNIGQRLFAKYVLGLSQGTVSELLSKPKPWDKLTEKGRDSYRKMHAWGCDENAVMLLKSLIPKKGKDTGIPAFGRDPDNMSEERIAHILNEASHLMKNQVEDSRSNDSKSPSHNQCPSPMGKDGSQNRRLKKYENDDIPQEKVVRIYQEELAKLMGRRMEDSIRGPREHFPSGGGNVPLGVGREDEIRVALDAYHRELAKLNTCPTRAVMPAGLPGLPGGLPGLLALQQQMNGVDLSLPKERRDSSASKMCNGDLDDERCKKDPTPSGLEAVADVLRHVGSAFSLVRPKIEPGVGVPTSTTGSSGSSPLGNTILPPALEDFTSSGPASASPLQRMASITNSLISQPSSTPHHSPSQRPLKAVLPPITQQQFDNFNNLNTEDIVKKVKESLSQYSISQRLFGESVLGLSQGSVSDLLARPKPWHMLTQKGREPFIRMKMYLEDDNAVHKLVASQYKIAPEKLMRTGSYAGGPACPVQLPKQNQQQPQQKFPSCNDLPRSDKFENSLLPPSLQLPCPPPVPHHHPQTSPLSSQSAPPHLTHTPHSQEKKPTNQLLHTHQQSAALRALQQHVAPSVYEMAALTQDLDTQTITTKIKEALLANNIGQKIFGEAVLGLSQGSVSELLSKPKPWHMLSIKGREPFIRMQLWLSDSHNIDRLQALKNERREANKRRRSHQDNGSDTSSNDTSEFYHSPSPGPPSAKKQRVLFSEEQKEALRLAFALDSYPNVATIEFLGSELALSSRTITNWFHNHRMRLKQQTPHDSTPGSRDGSTGGQPFDPVQFRMLLNQRLLELQKERMGLGAVPLPYPPYFNNNLAALIASRGMLPDMKEQFSGLDLSMGGLKRVPDYDDDDDDMVSDGEDSNMSVASLGDTSDAGEEKKTPMPASGGGRSRRKPAAPQWVNPEWQDKTTDKEVIINGVCVMRSEDYGIEEKEDEETVRVEPTPVTEDPYDSDDSEERPKSEAGSVAEEAGLEEEETEVQGAVQVRHSGYLKQDSDAAIEEEDQGKETSEEWQKENKRIKVEDHEERWEY